MFVVMAVNVITQPRTQSLAERAPAKRLAIPQGARTSPMPGFHLRQCTYSHRPVGPAGVHYARVGKPVGGRVHSVFRLVPCGAPQRKEKPPKNIITAAIIAIKNPDMCMDVHSFSRSPLRVPLGEASLS